MSRVFVLFLQAVALAAQTAEVDQLLRRVDELEAQNRKIAAALQEVKAKLAALESGPARPTPPQRAAEPTQWPEIADRDRRLKLYGFIRLDLDIDSQTPNSAQTPLFVTTPDPRQSNGARSFSMHPRLSRFGLDYSGPRLESLGAPDLFGKIEVDFENGGSESRQIIRIRHAYLQSRWGAFSLLAGQTWDIFSPLFPTVNNDTLMWNAGNVGDRRPQLRADWEPKAGHGQWSFEGGIGLMNAIDASDLDGNGFRDGEQSGRPNLQSRVGYSRSLWTDQPLRFGASAFYGWLKVVHPMFNRTMFHSQGVNFDFTLPIARAIGLRGKPGGAGTCPIFAAAPARASIW
jgi:hypothetical protein